MIEIEKEANMRSTTKTAVTQKELEFRLAMRKLWEDHVVWTRNVIISVAGGLPDLNFAVQRLMQNQDDIGDAVKQFFGDAGGNQLTSLLKEHITGAYNVLVAAKAGDKPGLDKANKAWYENADDIAMFLSKANPKYWPEKDMKMHMKDHLDLSEAEAVARLQGKWAEDVSAYDRVHVQILRMADMLSDGIIGRFSEKFR
jgi:hypothetical protein